MFFRSRYFRDARKLRLSSDQKEEARAALTAFMAEHPVREGAAVRPTRTKAAYLRPALAFALIVLLAGAGTASAAERALPDNAPLYFIKTAINEPIRRTLAVTPEAKAEVEAELATRRLEEAEALAATERLTPTIQKRIEERLVTQVENAQTRIAALNEAGKSQVATRVQAKLEVSLEVHGKALVDLSRSQTTTTRETLAPVIKRVREKTEALAQERRVKEAERRRERRSDRAPSDMKQAAPGEGRNDGPSEPSRRDAGKDRPTDPEPDDQAGRRAGGNGRGASLRRFWPGSVSATGTASTTLRLRTPKK